ncbi:MAG: DUF4325 domain-containing protein [Magnetococcales bacterium]|nr:DUF4325 domain-containing protein [Magnetococcales bacterium]
MDPFHFKLPANYSFKQGDLYDFDAAISWYDWTATSQPVDIDLRPCTRANYNALSLLVLYVWELHARGCRIAFKTDERGDENASRAWKMMGAKGWWHVLQNSSNNFRASQYKPLLAIRDRGDFSKALSKVEAFVSEFNVEYENTLRYVLSELLYNTLEHGVAYRNIDGRSTRIPSLIQFTWYRRRNELQFLIADLGVGIKNHLEQNKSYQPFASDAEAILFALRPQVSGTFGRNDPYRNKDNAGVGLYLSSQIVRRLRADLYIISGNGLVHVSPTDVTSQSLRHAWPGTFVLFDIHLSPHLDINFHQMMSELRESARREVHNGHSAEEENIFYFSLENYFGRHAEDKASAILHRDRSLIPAVDAGKTLRLDFDNVQAAPHSFLSALLATPVKRLGMAAYKKIKILNATPEIRETIDYILDENTS